MFAFYYIQFIQHVSQVRDDTLGLRDFSDQGQKTLARAKSLPCRQGQSIEAEEQRGHSLIWTPFPTEFHMLAHIQNIIFCRIDCYLYYSSPVFLF